MRWIFCVAVKLELAENVYSLAQAWLYEEAKPFAMKAFTDDFQRLMADSIAAG